MTDQVAILLCYTNKGKINSHLLQILNNNLELKVYLDNRYVDSESYNETVYRIKHNIEMRPVCKVCGKSVAYKGGNKGFNAMCSVSCSKKYINVVNDVTDINIVLNDIIEDGKLNNNKLQDKYLLEHGYYNIINALPGKTYAEKLYLSYNKINTPVCKECGKTAMFLNFNKGYSDVCSNECNIRFQYRKEITDNDIIDIVSKNDGTINTVKLETKYLKNMHLYEYLLNRFPDSNSISETVYRIKNKIEIKPACIICGAPAKFISLNKGYSHTCSRKCSIIKSITYEKQNIDVNDIYIKELYSKSSGAKKRRQSLMTDGTYSYLKNRFSDTTNVREAIYRICNNIVEAPTCEICGSKLQFKHNRYKSTCSAKCSIRKSNQDFYSSIGIDTTIRDNEIIVKNCCEKHKIIRLSPSTFYRRLNNNECLCPHCNPHVTTSIEDTIISILKKLNIKYYIHDRRQIYPLELDVYLPDYNVGIECNGIYWHCEKVINDKYKHLEKFNKCKENNIRLLTFWENDILNNTQKIEHYLMSVCGLNKKIYARNCDVKEIDSVISKQFIDKNHLQGSINASIRLGLFYNDELVQVMTFGKLRKALGQTHKEGSYELYRLCSKGGYTIIGGASKLLKYFKLHYEWQEIISYCEKEISNGNVYEKLGFSFDKDCGLSFCYFNDKGEKFNRFSLRKSVVDDGSGRSADEILKDKGYLKCWNIGNYKYILKNSTIQFKS